MEIVRHLLKRLALRAPRAPRAPIAPPKRDVVMEWLGERQQSVSRETAARIIWQNRRAMRRDGSARVIRVGRNTVIYTRLSRLRIGPAD